jgi:excisionase family DNA binding protein
VDIPAIARLLGLAAAASYMGVSTWTIRRWLAEGVVPRVRLPGGEGGEVDRLLFDVTDLDALIERGKA